MDWDTYKQLCDRPDVWSRWMLEQTQALLKPALAAELAAVLGTQPVTKPRDHRGGAATDMFVLELPAQRRSAVAAAVRQAKLAGRITPATAARGLGGFVEAWQEYADWSPEPVDDASNHYSNDKGNTSMSDQTATVIELIEAFNAIDLDRVLACFAENADYHNMPMEKVTGVAAIRQVLEGFLGGASAIQWDLLNIAEADGVVLTERVDKFEINGNWIALPVMGTFELADGKITAWRDYFDLNDFQTQFANAMSG